ncbi:hypothetical protein NIBR502774_17650 (plasmid) [Rhizobium sp. NIBRBAC000502774]|nr:hypothetical protein NIBR502774_17650 [Rhizobium sp. NIBRBAC000502774]
MAAPSERQTLPLFCRDVDLTPGKQPGHGVMGRRLVALQFVVLFKTGTNVFDFFFGEVFYPYEGSEQD